MTTSISALLAVAALTWVSLWLAVRAAPFAQFEHLPGRYRRRVRWWLANACHLQAACLVVVVLALVLVCVRALR